MFVLVAVGYGLLATSAYELFGALTIGVTFFPPAGLTLAAFLLLPRRVWPAVAAGIVVGELTVDLAQGQALAWSLGWATANLVEPLVGAAVIRRLSPVLAFSRRFVVAFLVGGLLVGPACGAAIGATVLARSGGMWLDAFPSIWVGDALGVLVVAPLVLVLSRPEDFVLRRTTDLDVVLVTVVTAAVTFVLVLVDELPLGYAAIVLLAIPAARYSAREVAISGAVVASVLTAATARGRGPWAALAEGEAHAELVQQQAFLLVALGSAWLLKLEVVERVKAVSAAKSAEAELVATREQARNERHLLAMHEALSSLAVATTSAEVLDAVAVHASSVFDATAVIVAVEDDRGDLTVLTASGPWVAEIAAGQTVAAGAPDPLALAAWSGRLTLAPGAPTVTDPDAVGTSRHHIAVPLGLATKTGVLGLTRSGDRRWTENAQIRAMAFASMIADALDRVERYDVEHRVALTLQHAILPRHLPSLPGTHVAGRYLPATDALEVGGDWYDVIVDEERRTMVVVIGDVAGHSLSAAAEMGNLASASRALVYAGHGPSELIDDLDLVVAGAAQPTMTTMVCAHIDIDRCRVRYSLAGHPPPLVRTAAGVVRRLDGAASPPIGTGRRCVRTEAVATLAPGDSLLFYTDGLVEQRRAPIDDRLAALERAFAATGADAGRACDDLVSSMLSSSGHEDDVALVCVTLA